MKFQFSCVQLLRMYFATQHVQLYPSTCTEPSAHYLFIGITIDFKDLTYVEHSVEHLLLAYQNLITQCYFIEKKYM